MSCNKCADCGISLDSALWTKSRHIVSKNSSICADCQKQRHLNIMKSSGAGIQSTEMRINSALAILVNLQLSEEELIKKFRQVKTQQLLDS